MKMVGQKTVVQGNMPRSQTIIDITLATEGAARRIDGWRVLEDFAASDHEYFFFWVQIQS